MSSSEARDVFKGSAGVHRVHNNGKRDESIPGLGRPRQVNTLLPQGVGQTVGHLHGPERWDDGFPTGQLIQHTLPDRLKVACFAK